ncbi:MAG: efflux RND transporter periplasmic adaptor subunit, partial [Planctomycetaceae bacterium]
TVLLAGIPSTTHAQDFKSTHKKAPPAVVVASVVERSIKTGHRSVGTVMPIRKTTVGSAVDGRVLKHNVNQGDPVIQGQILAQLRTQSLQIELRAAKAETTLRQHELAELENGSRPEEIAEARAKFSAAEVVRSNATAKHKRAEALFAKTAINQVDLDDARERFDATHQAYLAAQAMLKRVEAGPRSEQIAQAQARLELQEARTDQINDRLAKFTIVAPFSGFVAMEHTEVGAWVSQGDAIVEIIQLDIVEVCAHVPAKHAVQLRRGATVLVEFPELKNQIFTGQVERVVPTANVQTRTFPVNIRVTNRFRDGRPLLMAGMLAQVELPTGTLARMPLVPKDALVLNGASRSVFVVDVKPSSTRDTQTKIAHRGTGTVRRVPVRLGIADDSMIQVEGDLRADQLVVVRGNERLKDGQDITFTRATPQDDSP